MPDQSAEVYQFGDFRLDVGEHTLRRRPGGERVVIPDKAFQALVHLVRHHGALVTRDQILATVWPGVLVEDANIGKVIHIARRALGDANGEGTYIETVPNTAIASPPKSLMSGSRVRAGRAARPPTTSTCAER